MADDPQKRLEDHAHVPVPAIDPGFADRLESKLRVEHASIAPAGQRRVRVLLPRLVAAVAVVTAGVVGVAALTPDDASVPVAVVDEEPTSPLDTAADGGDGDEGDQDEADPEDSAGGLAMVDPSVTPQPTLASATPTASISVAPTPTTAAQPTGVPSTSPSPTVTPTAAAPATAVPDLSSTTVPTTTVPTTTVPSTTPSTTVPSTPVPTPTAAAPTSTVQAAPTQVPVATPQPVPSPTATVLPTPTVEREPTRIELSCAARVAGDALGVVCSWDTPETDRVLAGYRIMRTRNGGEAQEIVRRRADAPTFYTDRAVEFGDQVIYLVQGFDADDRVIAASVREIVRVRRAD